MIVLVFFFFTVKEQNRIQGDDPERRPDDHRRRPAVVLDVQLQPRLGRRRRGVRVGRRRDGLRGRHPGRAADAVAGQGPERAGLPALARRHPLLLGAVVPLQDGRGARVVTTGSRSRRPARAPSRAAAPSCAASTTRGCCSTSRSSTRRSTTPTSTTSPSRATPAPPSVAATCSGYRASSHEEGATKMTAISDRPDRHAGHHAEAHAGPTDRPGDHHHRPQGDRQALPRPPRSAGSSSAA